MFPALEYQYVCIFFLYHMFSDMAPSCAKCKRYRPFVTWDKHGSCLRCRPCTKATRCNVCVNWPEDRWKEVEDWMTEKARKKDRDSSASEGRGSLGKTPAKKPAKPRKPSTSTSSHGPGGPQQGMGANGNPQPREDPVRMVSERPIQAPVAERLVSERPSLAPDAERLVSERPSLAPDTERLVSERPSPTREASRSAGPTRNPGGPEGLVPRNRGQSQDRRPESREPGRPGQGTALPGDDHRDDEEDRASDIWSSVGHGSLSDSQRDFEGFPAQVSVPRRKRHRADSRSEGEPQATQDATPWSDPAFVDNLKNLFTQWAQPSQATQQPQDQAPAMESRPADRDPWKGPEPKRRRPEEDQPPERGHPADSDLEETEEWEYSAEEEELVAPAGADFTAEAFAKAVETIRRVLQYDDVPANQPTQAQDAPKQRQSRLSLGRAREAPGPSMPVDGECYERFERLAGVRTWKPTDRVTAPKVKVDEEGWQDLFVSPTIPTAAADNLRASGAMNMHGKYTSTTSSKSQTTLRGIDQAARHGMKVASTLLLIAEVATTSFQQSSEEGISRKDTGNVISLLAP